MSWLSERLARILYPPGVTRLDPKLATALFLILFAAQLTLTTPFSFLPAMVTSFGYKDRDRGFYAGMIASSLFVGRFFGGYFWGWLTDKLGRRPVLLISAFLTYVATIAFGFTTNIYWAITTRFLQGLFNGVIVVGRAAFAEICDETNQAIGVALVFAAWNSAIVLGPALGGFLATPVKKYPNVFRGENVQAFFTKYAFLLPSVFISLILILSILLIFFTFEETMPKRSPSPFEEIVIDEKKGLLTEEMDEIQKDDEGSLAESRCSEQDDEKKKCCDVTGWSIIELCRDKTLVLVVVMFGISGFSIIGFSELRSLWMATNIKYGGLSFSTDKIGIALLAPAIISVILQPIIFGRLERKLGGITTLRMTLFILALFTALFPLIRLSHSNRYLMWALLVIFGIVRMIADISSRSCIALFINNAVTAEKVGRANGFAFSVQEIMRVASPTMLGSLFAWSINERYHSITFPLDYHLSFFLIALFIGVILTLAYFLPKTINSPKDNNKTDTTIACRIESDS